MLPGNDVRFSIFCIFSLSKAQLHLLKLILRMLKKHSRLIINVQKKRKFGNNLFLPYIKLSRSEFSLRRYKGYSIAIKIRT